MPEAPPAAGAVGRGLPRREDAVILEGRARYLDDLDPAGVAHLAFVRSPYAHARVLSVQEPDPEPGLVAVITPSRLAGRVRPLPIQAPEGAWTADEPHPVLPDAEVRYAGQPVAAVVAESRALAEDFAELVEVDYEPLDAVVDARLSERDLMRWEGSGGDVEGAFEAADVVVQATHFMPRLAAAPMEARGALAAYDADADLLTVWVSAQDQDRQLNTLAPALDRPRESIRVRVPAVGGAFGSKGVAAPETVVTAVAAMELGRPVKWAEDRMENFVAAYQGRGVGADVELALDASGRMLGLRARLVADLGGYLMPTTAIPPHTAAKLMCGCYTIPAAQVEVVGRQTHKVPTGPYRGAGRPEAAYFLERTVDVAARRLGLDPVELRRRNLIDSFPHRTPLGWTYDSGDYRRCLDLALGLAGDGGAEAPDPNRVSGTGVAMYVERSGGVFEAARASLEPDGRVLLRSSTAPHGQGHETTFAQIAADRLGLEPDRVALEFGDSATAPRGTGTYGSRSVAMGGSAVVKAIDALIERGRAAAAVRLESAPGELSYAAGEFAGPDGRTLSLAELATASGEPLRAEARFESDVVFSSGAYAAAVEIDRTTGRLAVRRLAAVDDAGTIVNPLLAEGQVLGGAVQGLGQCLVEEMLYDEEGQPTSASFADYSLLTAAEQPAIATAFVESPSPLNPLGAKGVGEGGAIGTPAAVGNAIAAALGGVEVDPPFTPEKLWRALQGGAR